MKHLEISPDANRPSRATKIVAVTRRIGQMIGKLMESSLDATPILWDGVIDGPSVATSPLSQPTNSDPNAQPPEAQATPPTANKNN